MTGLFEAPFQYLSLFVVTFRKDKPHNCCIASYIEVELNKRNSNIPKRPRPTITTRTGTARGRGPCANVAPSTLCKEPGEGVVPTGTGKQRRLPLATA